MSLLVKESSPANIALIKYMGKKDHSYNLASNPSLSWTIDHLRTFVEVHKESGETDRWEPLEGEFKLDLNRASQDRFLNFWRTLKSELHISGKFLLKSRNNFPFGCGLASSASSFSALTRAAYALSLSQGQPEKSVEELAALSARGSGSSCRSLLSGWVEWSESGVRSVELPYKNLIHKVIVVEAAEKKVSSSQAHQKIATSLLNEGRGARAQERLSLLKKFLVHKDWRQAYEVCWAEFWDMHSLFETSSPSFGYMTSESLRALNLLRKAFAANQDGPLVTMDAGPNIHLLFREDQNNLCQDLLKGPLSGLKVL